MRNKPTKSRLNILFEDADVLVVNKPAGLLTSTVPTEKRPTLLKMVREHIESPDQHRNTRQRARVGVIHRLDRDASGLLVFTKNEQAYRAMKNQFFQHTVDRVYLAIVHGTPKPVAGRIESRLVELPNGSVRTSRHPTRGERAITDYRTEQRHEGKSLVRVTLLTGRKHQIRAHLSEKHFPIVGDTVYGKQDKAPRLMLVAVELAFDHPRTGERKKFTIVPSKEMIALVPVSSTKVDTSNLPALPRGTGLPPIPASPPTARPSDDRSDDRRDDRRASPVSRSTHRSTGLQPVPGSARHPKKHPRP